MRLALIITLTILILLPSVAHALSIKEAKSSGLVGEKQDGYIAAISASPTSEVQALIDQINEKRRDKYNAISKKNGQAINVVEKLAGMKFIKRTKAGNYYMNERGEWVKK